MKSMICILVLLAVFTSCQQIRYADIVFVVDEGLHRDAMMWIDSSVSQLEYRLTSSGIGEGNRNNLYGLVLFGATGDSQTNVRRILAPNNAELSIAQVFSQNLPNVFNNLKPTGSDTHDGYAAIYRALDISWRPGSSRAIIFITDRERDIVLRNITSNILVTRLVDSRITIHTILNISIMALTGGDSGPLTRNPALGVIYANQSLAYYVTDGNRNTESSPFPVILSTDPNSSIVYDYASLPDLIGFQVYNAPIISTLWPLQYVYENNTSQGQAFNDIFFHNIDSALQQTNISQIPCQMCHGNNCYFLAEVLVTGNRASSVCMSRIGKLADISDQNQINNLRNFYNQNFYINSFQSNTKPCLAVIANSTTTVDCNQLHAALCQVDRNSLFGC